MIDESLIQEHTGTSFSIEKIDGVSVMTFADNSNHKIDNNIRTALVFAGDCTDCGAYYNMYNGANWGDILVLGLGTGASGNRTNVSMAIVNVNASSSAYGVVSANFEFLDDAQDTNAHTYKLQWASTFNSQYIYINRPQVDSENRAMEMFPSSSITVMEVVP